MRPAAPILYSYPYLMYPSYIYIYISKGTSCVSPELVGSAIAAAACAQGLRPILPEPSRPAEGGNNTNGCGIPPSADFFDGIDLESIDIQAVHTKIGEVGNPEQFIVQCIDKEFEGIETIEHGEDIKKGEFKGFMNPESPVIQSLTNCVSVDTQLKQFIEGRIDSELNHEMKSEGMHMVRHANAGEADFVEGSSINDGEVVDVEPNHFQQSVAGDTCQNATTAPLRYRTARGNSMCATFSQCDDASMGRAVRISIASHAWGGSDCPEPLSAFYLTRHIFMLPPFCLFLMDECRRRCLFLFVQERMRPVRTLSHAAQER